MRGASCHLHTKYGKKILPELGDPEERGPSSISEAAGDKNKRIINALTTSYTQTVKIQSAVVSHNTWGQPWCIKTFPTWSWIRRESLFWLVHFNETPTPASVIAPTTPTDTIRDNFLQTLINEQTEATAQAGKLRQLQPPRSPLIAEFHEANSHFMANNITAA